MSNSDLQGQRKSWRQQQKSGGNRWIGRILFTLIATALLILFLCIIFWPRPERELQTFLIHAKAKAGAYQKHVIMPPMYGANAAVNINDRLKPVSANHVEITGTVDVIKREIDEKLTPTLDDEDDTILIIFRGYLLNGINGPAIACSDFGAKSSKRKSGDVAGLLSLDEVFKVLSDHTPDSFQGTRLVVLDIEPFTAMPHLNQYDHEIFQALEKSVSSYDPHLWVLVTRGPLQNVGWDAKRSMPIATQTLLDALTGDANRQEDNDYQLDLRELVTYTAQRYKKLDEKSGANLPTPLLLRGGRERFKTTSQIDPAWVARAPYEEDPETPEEKEDTENPELNTAPEPDTTVSHSRLPWGVTASPVVFHPVQEENDTQNDTSAGDKPNADDSAGQAVADGDETGSKADRSDERNEGQAKASAVKKTLGANGDELQSAPDTFWTFRDRLESLETGGMTKTGTRPSPIAIAPDIWKRMNQVVLHAEIESLDSITARSSEQVLEPALIGIRQLESIVQSGLLGNTSQLDKSQVLSEIVQLLDAWKTVDRDETGRNTDRNVTLADRLQHAIVVANMRKWGWQTYQREAIGIGTDVTSPFDSDETLIDAITVLADQQGDSASGSVSESAMRRALRKITQIVQASDDRVKNEIEKLLNDFERALESANDKSLNAQDIKFVSAWREVRFAHAWLRSSLPTAQQRHELITAIAKAKVDTDLDDPPETYFEDTLLLATPSSDKGTFIQNRDQQEAMSWEPIGDASESANKAVASLFGESLAAALLRDPMVTVIDTSPNPIIHAVEPLPRVLNPTIAIVDANGSPVDDKVRLSAKQDYLEVTLSPDSDMQTRFKLRVAVESRTAETEAKWAKDGRDLEDPEIIVSVPANASVSYRLNVNAPEATNVATTVPISITIDPIDPPDENVKSLKRHKTLNLLLPQPDQIRVLVKTDGLTDHEQHVSDESFKDGVWLRTFVSRPTQFSLSAYNHSGKACRARVWLLKLDHPFPGQEIREYFPDVMKSRVNSVRKSLLNADQRVARRTLEGDQRLRGPKLIHFAAGHQPSNISWKPEPPAEGEQEAAEPEPFPEGGLDGSHGMALVFRLIDDQDFPIGGDQIVWLIPKPWSPEDYVDIKFSDSSRDGKVKVTPLLRQRIDGDNRPDELPKKSQIPVEVQWREDQIGRGFEPGTEQEPAVQPVGIGGLINVQLANESRSPILRLGVDGWPRALRWQINPNSPTESKKELDWHSVQFASVTMDYGETPPGSGDDEKLEPTKTIFNPPQSEPIYFRGGGKSLMVRVHADISTTFPKATLKLMDGDDVFEQHMSDRKFRTVINEITNKGDESLMFLTTTVEDLDFVSTAGTYKDAEVVFRPQVDTGTTTRTTTGDEAELNIHLDSTRPEANLRINPPNGPYYEGTTVTWIAEYSDRGAVSSGVKKINFAKEDGEGKPAGKKHSVGRGDEQRIEMKLMPNMESAAMAVQVWDGVGLASRPVDQSIPVSKRKPSKTKMAESANGGDPGNGRKASPKKIKRGKIAGRIETRSSLRGILKLSPAPKKIIPSSGEIKIGGANPQFKFTNVPEGEYALIFAAGGTKDGRTMEKKIWSGLKIHNAGGEESLNLKLGDAE